MAKFLADAWPVTTHDRIAQEKYKRAHYARRTCNRGLLQLIQAATA